MIIGLLTSFALGLRHGVDWDHIAAIADLSSSAESRRRGFWLSFLYAAGHAVVVMVLGIAAIAFGTAIPSGVDEWMGRIVGLTLLVLGVWILVDLLRKGRDFRLRSRWILVFGGTFAGLRRVRDATTRRRLAVEHDHDHEHVEADDLAVDGLATGADAPEDPQVHDHAHGALADDPAVIDLTADEVADPGVEAAAEPLAKVASGSSGARGWIEARTGRFGHRHGPGGHSHRHGHRHRHELALAADQPGGPGNGTAAGIGFLHGIGVESPTQIAVFVASTSVAGAGAGIALLAAWVVGLVIANSGLAALAAVGLLEAERNFTIYAAVAVFVAVSSAAMGALLLFGLDGVLPAI